MNFVALLVAAIAAFLVGWLWYSNILFGKPWMKELGKKESNMDKDKMMPMMGGMFVSTLLMAYVLSMFMEKTGAASLMEGVMVAFWAWLGFVATTMFANNMFGGRSTKLFLIDAGHFLAALVVMGAILGAWR